MSFHDPLDLLRQSISQNREPILLTATSQPADSLSHAASIAFPQASLEETISISKDAPTRYARTDALDDFYSIGQLWLAWIERDGGVRDYLMKGQAAGVGYVAITDRRGVVDYLQGLSDGGGRILPKGGVAPVNLNPVVVESLPPALGPTADAGPSKQTQLLSKRKYEVDISDREFCKSLRADEIELQNCSTVLRGAVDAKVNNFQSFVQSVMSERIRALRKSFESSGGRNQPNQQASALDPSRGSRKSKPTNPIIMISSSPTALITMWNVKKFLEQGIFEPSEVTRQSESAQGNNRAEDMIPILRKRTGPNGEVTSKYYVVDGVEALQKFGQDPWDRVVCVITTGQAWQFKPYKWMEPKTLFRNVKGIYFQWNNEPSNPAVRDWNVTEMRIDRQKRHTDRQVVAEFWRSLDSAKKR